MDNKKILNDDFLGPFLMRPTTISMGFWVSFGPSEAPEHKVEIKILKTSKVYDLKKVSDSKYGVYCGCTTDPLTPGIKYSYQLLIDGTPSSHPSLNDSDLYFWTLSDDSSTDFNFFLVSCNGVQYHEDKRYDAFNMWQKLNDAIDESRQDGSPGIHCGILGGDQVYMDKAFSEKIDSVPANDIYEQYLVHWRNQTYRKIMAKVPCFLTWDDHDLIDGFGSRTDQFIDENSEFKNWANYRESLTRAYYEMQAIRNGDVSPQGPFSSNFRWFDIGISLMDLRSERNFLKGQMLSETSKEKIKFFVLSSNPPLKHLFLTTPVILVRMGGAIEKHLGTMSNWLWSSMAYFSYGPGRLKTIFAILMGLLVSTPANFTTLTLLKLDKISSSCFIGLLLILGISVTFFKKSLQSKLVKFIYGLIAFGACIGLGYLQLEAFRTYCKYTITVATLLLLLWTTTKIKAHGFKYIILILALCSVFIFNTIYLVLNIAHSIGNAWLLNAFLISEYFFTLIVFLIASLTITESIDTFADLDDDIKDGWSSTVNKAEFKWILNLLKETIYQGVTPYILSGDIHTGGWSKIRLPIKGSYHYVSQVVSSPIGYTPMPSFAERITSADGLEPIEVDSEISAMNMMYRGFRNFVIIKSQHRGEKRVVDANFYYEDCPEYIRIRGI